MDLEDQKTRTLEMRNQYRENKQRLQEEQEKFIKSISSKVPTIEQPCKIQKETVDKCYKKELFDGSGELFRCADAIKNYTKCAWECKSEYYTLKQDIVQTIDQSYGER